MSAAGLTDTGAQPARLPALDAVRAIGAVGVLVYHVGFNTGFSLHGTWNGLLARLDVGVAIFFVLSGFLLFRPYAHAVATGTSRPAAGRYLWRRALRILPAYWLLVAVSLVVLPQNRGAPAADWLYHLTFTQVYQHGLIRHGLGQTWSLATEVAFYLALPLLPPLLLGRRWRPLRSVLVAGLGFVVTAAWVALMGLGYLNTDLHVMWLPSYGAWFGAGIALATVHVARSTDTGPRGWRVLDELANAPIACWSVAVGLLAIASTPMVGPRDLLAPTAGQFGVKMALYAAIAVFVMVPLAFGPPNRVKAAFGAAPARWLGAISYGIFLWHPFLIDWTYRPGGRPIFTGDVVSTVLVILAGTLLLASISYYGVERPIQRWGARRPRRRLEISKESQSAKPATSTAI